jgi:molybdate transport system substrate-binding protein
MIPRRLKSTIIALFAFLTGFGVATPAHEDEVSSIRVLAAGSLRAAFGEVGVAFTRHFGAKVENNFGPSGLLRERIEKGEPADLFASADMGNPRALSEAGKSGPVVLFARNRLCAFVRPALPTTSDTLLATLLDPQIKLGTSTPKADPAGDYTWSMFANADTVRPGSRALLEAKALKLVGGLTSTAPPPGTDVFAWHLREGHADVFVGYCSAGESFKKSLPEGTVVGIPSELATGADYGMTLLPTQNQSAPALALFILSEEGQKILSQYGFDAPLLAGSYNTPTNRPPP